MDVFLTKSSFSFDDVFAVPVGFSDHYLIIGAYLARRSHQPLTHKVIYALSNQKFDSALLCDLFTDESCDAVFSFSDQC